MIEEYSQYEVNIFIQVSLSIMSPIPRTIQPLHGVLDLNVEATSGVNCLQDVLKGRKWLIVLIIILQEVIHHLVFCIFIQVEVY